MATCEDLASAPRFVSSDGAAPGQARSLRCATIDPHESRVRAHRSSPRRWPQRRPRRQRGRRAAADRCVDQPVRRSASTRARRSRADPHRQLARRGSRGIDARERSAAAHVELRHGRGAPASSHPTSCSPGRTRARSRARCCDAWAIASSSSSPRTRSRTSSATCGSSRGIVGQAARGEQLVATLRENVRAIEANRPAREPGRRHRSAGRLHGRRDTRSPTSCSRSRACRNVAAEQGLDRWEACRWRRCCAALPMSSC